MPSRLKKSASLFIKEQNIQAQANSISITNQAYMSANAAMHLCTAQNPNLIAAAAGPHLTMKLQVLSNMYLTPTDTGWKSCAPIAAVIWDIYIKVSVLHLKMLGIVSIPFRWILCLLKNNPHYIYCAENFILNILIKNFQQNVFKIELPISDKILVFSKINMLNFNMYFSTSKCGKNCVNRQ